MAMFSFTKVESWRNVNFLPKCTRLHKLRFKFQNFPGGDTPRPLPRSALRASTRGSMVPPEFHTPPWNKRLDKALHWIVLYTVHVAAFSLGGGGRSQCTIKLRCKTRKPSWRKGKLATAVRRPLWRNPQQITICDFLLIVSPAVFEVLN